MLLPSLCFLGSIWLRSRGILRGIRRDRDDREVDPREAMSASLGDPDGLGVHDPGVPWDSNLQHAVPDAGFQPIRACAQRQGKRASELPERMLENLELQRSFLIGGSDLPGSLDLEKSAIHGDLDGFPRHAGDVQGYQNLVLSFPERDRR